MCIPVFLLKASLAGRLETLSRSRALEERFKDFLVESAKEDAPPRRGPERKKCPFERMVVVLTAIGLDL